MEKKPVYDVISFLDVYRIQYRLKGKNVGREDVNIKCFNCVDDPSYHLGIHRKYGIFYCWRCGISGNFIKLVYHLLGCDYGKAEEIADAFQISDGEYIQEDDIVHFHGSGYRNTYLLASYYPISKVYRSESIEKVKKEVIDYCKKRGVLPSIFMRWFFDKNGNVVIPVSKEGIVVNYVKRNIRDDNNRYYVCSNRYAKIPIKNIFYSLDHFNTHYRIAVLVEGIFDAVKLGLDISLCMFGKKISANQVELLNQLNVKEVFICLDSDADSRDYESIFFLIKEKNPAIVVNKIKLKKGDLNDMSKEDILSLRKEILRGG